MKRWIKVSAAVATWLALATAGALTILPEGPDAVWAQAAFACLVAFGTLILVVALMSDSNTKVDLPWNTRREANDVGRPRLMNPSTGQMMDRKGFDESGHIW